MGTEFRAVVEDLKVNCDEIGAVVVTGEGTGVLIVNHTGALGDP
mgnify:CR=1 FL=1